jgi:DNA-binding NarL/FixJ family response regulator
MHSILVVDHNTLLRQGLRALISAQGEFEVVGEAIDGKDALSKATTCTPDLVLIDAQLHGMCGLQAMTQIKRRLPNTRVIMLTETKTNDCVRESLLAGVDGYVLKDASFEELLIALRSVTLGKKYLSPDVSQMLVQGYLHPQAAVDQQTSAASRLTTRERSILQLVAEGRTNRAAAEFLSISPKTVEKHRASLMRKFGLRNATELTLAAMDMGLIERPAAVGQTRLAARRFETRASAA